MLDCKRVLKAFSKKLHWFRIKIQKKNFKDMPELTEVRDKPEKNMKTNEIERKFKQPILRFIFI